MRDEESQRQTLTLPDLIPHPSSLIPRRSDMSEATLKPPRGPAPRCAPPPTEGGWADSPWQRLRDALPPRTVCGLAVLVSLLIPALLLWFPMPMVIGGVVGLLI